jgi:hypothetical protein
MSWTQHALPGSVPRPDHVRDDWRGQSWTGVVGDCLMQIWIEWITRRAKALDTSALQEFSELPAAEHQALDPRVPGKLGRHVLQRTVKIIEKGEQPS